jgi:hypothetical protein
MLLWLFAVPLVAAQGQEQHFWNSSGNEFISLCVPDEPTNLHWDECMGYVIGIDDGIQLAYDIQGKPQPYCIPSEVTTGQMVRVLIKFIKDHPEKAHSKTSVLAVESFITAFPCKRPSKKQ